MELTELSLAPTLFVNVDQSNMNNLYSESENNKPSKKRKMFPSSHDHHDLLGPPLQASVDLHVKNPLPLDWEQCLDLESGRKYYLNRKTLRKSWNLPKDQLVDLELNMSSSNCITAQTDRHHQTKNFKQSNYILDHSNNNSGHDQDDGENGSAGSNNNMVALACLNCHLLVILSRICPACPNCKYVHSLPTLQTSRLPQQHHKSVSNVKSLNTLSLLN